MKIAVLFGGISAEKEISLATGRYIYQLLDQSRFIGTPVFLDQNGRIWHIPDKLVIQNTTRDIDLRLNKDAVQLKYEDLSQKFDVVFNALLGKFGEDGCIQGVLELIGVPYTGSGILSSALAMDKKVMRSILTAYGFLVPKATLIFKNDWLIDQAKIISQITEEIGYPNVVKPTREGSSVGVYVAHKTDEIAKVIEQAFNFDNEVLVEEFINGREFMCVVFGNRNPRAMLPTEVEFEGEIHTYESKYMPGKSQYFTPIRVDDDVINQIQKQAVEIYEKIGLKGYGRVDGFVKNDKVYIGEVHTGTIMVPSSYVFHEVSRTKTELKGKSSSIPMTPRLWVTKIIEMAEEAHNNKKGLL